MPFGLEDLTAEDLAWPSTEDDLRALLGNQQAYAYLEAGEAGWYRRINGYRIAAITIAERIERDPHLAHGLVYPLGNCWRHHLELQLKQLLTDLRTVSGKAQPRNGDIEHSLLKLWQAARTMLKNIFGEESEGKNDVVEAVVRQLDELDSGGQDFRYPNRTDGKDVLKVRQLASTNITKQGSRHVKRRHATAANDEHQVQACPCRRGSVLRSQENSGHPTL